MNRYLLIIFSFMITPVLTNELSLLDLAQQGDSESQYRLGHQYHYGKKKDHVEAIKWYREAANRGSASAVYGISRLYLDNDSPQASDVKAYVWINILQDLILRKRKQGIKLDFKQQVINNKSEVLDDRYDGLVWANKSI